MRIARHILGLTAVGAAVMALSAIPASADYGAGSAYEVEISANLPGSQGGGIWLWLELTPSSPGASSGTGEYSGSDCGRGKTEHAVHDSGQVTWSVSGSTLTISGITLNGLASVPGINPVTIELPSAYGHQTTDFASTFPTVASALGIPSGAGFAQVQIAP